MTDKRVELAETIVRLTIENKIDWELLSGEDTVVAKLGSGRVVVSREPVDGSIDIVVRVYNQLGNVAEEFSDVTLNELEGEPSRWFRRLSTMLETARRQALGADQLIDDIIRELKGDDPF